MSRLEREIFEVDDRHGLGLLTAGRRTAPYLFVLVHGASREFQNAEHWLPHLSFFARIGRVYAVDLLGHGVSVPGQQDHLKRAIAADAQVLALEKLIFERKRTDQKLVLVGRSYGGRLVLDLANKLQEGMVQSIVLIAPALREDEISGLREEIKSLPTLFFWAEDDTTVPYERKKQLLDHFLSKEVVVFDGVLSEEKEEWQAHLPENIKVDEFQNKVKAWLSASSQSK